MLCLHLNGIVLGGVVQALIKGVVHQAHTNHRPGGGLLSLLPLKGKEGPRVEGRQVDLIAGREEEDLGREGPDQDREGNAQTCLELHGQLQEEEQGRDRKEDDRDLQVLLVV